MQARTRVSSGAGSAYPEHTAGRAPERVRNVRRLTVLVLAAIGVAAGLTLFPSTIADPEWRMAWREVAGPAPADAHPDGPVMVLGGSPTRLALALTLPDVPGPSRPLVLSASATGDWEARGGSCAAPHVHCVDPDPMSTFGEALALDRLASEHGWDAVTVVTSDFHVARTRWQFSVCTDVDVVVLAPGSGPSRDDHPRRERLKLVNAGLRTACR